MARPAERKMVAARGVGLVFVFGEEKREHSDSNKALKVQIPADGALTLIADVGQQSDE
jgi:hypothetical protein